ncbi:MAG: hypothetical protein J7M38_05080 [Armatimonadetes bacterium]|nr:hypothetical protein [Armatimonadota bacterium]
MVLRWCVAAMVTTCLLGATGTAVRAQESERAWVRDVVVLLVGPFGGDARRVEGKSVRDVLDDIRPDLAEWSDIHAPAYDDELRQLPYYPRRVVGGCEYEGAPAKASPTWDRWQEMFGEPWQPNAEHGVGMNVNGDLITTPTSYYVWRMCHNNSRWHKYQKESILRHVRAHDADVIRQDNIGLPLGVSRAGGFCPSCSGAFREHLRERYDADELARMGIEDLAHFDPASYVRACGYLNEPERAMDDPLMREFVYFLNLSNLRAWQDIVNEVHDIDPTMPICGNQGPAGYSPYGSVIVGRPNDVIFLEHNSPWLYPESGFATLFKLERAAGLHRKPVWVWDFGYMDKINSTAGAELFMADCYASGCVPYLVTNNFIYTGGKSQIMPCSRPTYDRMVKYARFAREHRDLLARPGRTPARVGLVYSLPSFFFKRSGALNMGVHSAVYAEQMEHFAELGAVLRRGHIPYEVVIFGGPGELWEDAHVLEELDRYKVLLLPNVEAISDAQIAALRAFTADGGRLLASGRLAERDEFFAPRQAVTPRLDVVDLGDPSAVNAQTKVLKGAFHVLTLNQVQATPLTVTAWTKCVRVSGPTRGDYSLYIDQHFTDGTRKFAGCAPGATGTHDWQKLEIKIDPAKPLQELLIYLLLRGPQTGTAWFDDVSARVQGSDENLMPDPACSDPSAWTAYGDGFDIDAEVGRTAPGSIRIDLPAPQGGEANPFRRTAAEALEQALNGSRLLRTDAPTTVYVNPIRKGDELLIHLVNYDWDAVADKMHPVGPIRLEWALQSGDHTPSGATLASPDHADKWLGVTVEEGCVSLVVPKLNTWAIVRLML